ncbi:MAG: methyl-accepting chemotaxis protein [Bacillota bacterium]
MGVRRGKAGMRVTARVRLGFAAIVWSTFVLSLLTFYAISHLTATLHRINTCDVPAIQLSGEISKKIYQTTGNVYLTIAGGGKVARPEDQLNEVKMLLGSLEELLRRHPSPDVRAILPMLDDISDAAGEYTSVLVRMQAEKDPERIYLLLRALSGKGEWLISRSEHMQLRIWEQIGPRMARTERLSTLLKVGVALAFAFAFVFGLCVSGIITRTLADVSHGIRKAAEAAHGESERSARLSAGMRASAGRTQAALEAVLRAFHGAVETSKVSSEASQRIAATMEDGADAARMLADRTQVTARAAGKTRSTVSSLGRRLVLASAVIRETILMVDCNVKTATEASYHVDALQEQMDRIDAVLQGITNIADQTGLIALDARIASARSGEGGRDFGRVAQEIGSLAEMSASAVEEVKMLMEGIKASTLDVVKSLGASAERVRGLSRQSSRVEEVFRAIQGSFDEILGLMDEVEDAAGKGAGEARLVQEAMAEILESARQVAAQAGELVGEMQDLAESAQEAIGASETLVEGIAGQARSAEEQSRLAGEVIKEIETLA